MSHNLPLPNSKTSRIYLAPFSLARDVIYGFSFHHNSKMWYTKICPLQLSTTSHHHLQSFIHSCPESPTYGYFMITSCCMYTLYGWLCMVVEGCVWLILFDCACCRRLCLTNFVTYIQQIVTRCGTECEFVTSKSSMLCSTLWCSPRPNTRKNVTEEKWLLWYYLYFRVFWKKVKITNFYFLKLVSQNTS